MLEDMPFDLISNFEKLEEYNINNQNYFESVKKDIHKNKKTIFYHIWNLNPVWCEAEDANRVLIIEKSILEAFPMSVKRVDFVLELAKNMSDKYADFNIVFIQDDASFKKLLTLTNISTSFYKDYPLCNHWLDVYNIPSVDRDWMYLGYSWKSGGFMNFWSKVNKK